ncbi:PI-PLC X domain-containing protein 1 [Parasteatoda tepidariorum]|uniref:PI-PLC X domain-containing protein 1 n=1 Tax=Parasteatoda tepidariorum TaxID=114398 RepID=UPI00077FD6AF|nr:PI-PLC X domain-containing protein 1 [Parasteatoda tepidariorum]
MILFVLQCLWTIVASQSSTGITDIYLTVSSLTDGGDRRLELNWKGSDPEALVALYNAPPATDRPPLVTIKGNSGGYFRTRFRFPEVPFTKLNLTSNCLGFWIAILKQERILQSKCIQGHPHWMHESRNYIGNLSLIDLMLPGSHNTGSHSRYNPDEDNVFSRYLYTQEEDVFNQLAYGIRYLDLRVAYFSSRRSPETLWITHSSFRTNLTVKDVIRQVKSFLQATNEIVIMDFHRFVTGFKSRQAGERHRDLISLLEREVGDIMIPVSFSTRASLETLWLTNKRLYVGYAEKRFRTASPYLFPAVKHLWGDVDEVDDLWSYLNDTVCENSGVRLTSAMAQLTPTTAGVLFNSYGGLRKMASLVNRRVTQWFAENWLECANIVSTDFILGNGITELAISVNKNRTHRANF